MTSPDPQYPEAVAAALAVMDAHIEGLNARDQAAIAATLHFALRRPKQLYVVKFGMIPVVTSP